MLNDPNNQIPGSSSNPNNNPGSSSQPSYNQMPYYPNYQTPIANPEELSLFNQWKMQNQFSQFQQHHHQQQPPNQATASQPQSDQQSFHLVDETEDENEEEPIPTPTSKKTSRGPSLKSKAIKNKEKETQVEVKKRARMVWSQDEELILAESFIQISEDPKTGKDTFWYKILEVHNAEAKRRGYMERTKNMLTGKWTPMNASVQKFNQLVSETLAHSGENDEDWMTRVEILYKTHTGYDFKHKSAWLFLEGKHKWKNPESTNAKESEYDENGTAQVDDMSADFIISQLLFLDAEDDKKDIKLFINSPGGSVTAGMGIYDAMKLCKADISTICVGLAASMGAFLLACGTKGKRFCMPNSRVMIHQPLGKAGGNATDMSIRIREMVYHKVKVNKIISRVSGTPYEKVEADTDRDYFMNAWEAKAYGLVDEVIDDGKPGLVAPIADTTPPPKTRVWDLWKVEGSRKALKNMPSEDKMLQNGRIGGEDGDGQKTEEAASA
ncbi:ATP-dependent Clp protease proteolytic subunit 3, chloroplastic [Tanacetum coccineum]